MAEVADLGAVREAKWPRRAVHLTVAAIFLMVAAVSAERALSFRYDFHHFYLDAAYAWERGALNPQLEPIDAPGTRQLPFYLPSVTCVLAPLAALGPRGAAVAWTLMQLASLAYVMVVLARWGLRRDGRPDPHSIRLWTLLVATPAVFEWARFNQLSMLVLAIVLAAVESLRARRCVRAGVWLGLAAGIKLLPLVLIAWLLAKRSWVALAATLLTLAAFAVTPSVLLLGPRPALRAHAEWWQHNVRGAPAQGMLDADLRAHFVDHRNQSISAVLGRLLWSGNPYAAAWQPLALDEKTVGRIALAVKVVLAGALLWCCRKPLAACSVERLLAEASAFCLAMMFFSPLLRQYYLVWSLPALCAFVSASGDGQRAQRRIGIAAIALWTVGMAVWPIEQSRVYGAHLWMTLGLACLALALAATRDRFGRADRGGSDATEK